MSNIIYIHIWCIYIYIYILCILLNLNFGMSYSETDTDIVSVYCIFIYMMHIYIYIYILCILLNLNFGISYLGTDTDIVSVYCIFMYVSMYVCIYIFNLLPILFNIFHAQIVRLAQFCTNTTWTYIFSTEIKCLHNSNPHWSTFCVTFYIYGAYIYIYIYTLHSSEFKFSIVNTS